MERLRLGGWLAWLTDGRNGNVWCSGISSSSGSGAGGCLADVLFTDFEHLYLAKRSKINVLPFRALFSLPPTRYVTAGSRAQQCTYPNVICGWMGGVGNSARASHCDVLVWQTAGNIWWNAEGTLREFWSKERNWNELKRISGGCKISRGCYVIEK